MQRAQTTAEYVSLLALLGVLGVALVAVFGDAARPRLDLGRGLLPRVSHRRFPTPDERALRSPTLAPLIRRAVPTLVLERAPAGDDGGVPVASDCRDAGCARLGSARPVLYVHVVHRRAGPVVELWAAHPEASGARLPLPALQGSHRDDWEGLLVAFDHGGRLLGARATAHGGFNGSAPWWELQREDWASYGGVAFQAAGTRALGLGREAIDLAGTAWEGDVGSVDAAAFTLLPADRAARTARAFDPGTLAPWRTRAWRDPGAASTGPPVAALAGAAAAARAMAGVH